MCLPGNDIVFLDGQCDGDVAATGVQGGQSPGTDLCREGTDREDDRKAELETGHLVTVDQDPDGWMLGGGDLVGSQVHQFDTSGSCQGTPGGGGEVPMLAPSANQHADQVNVQEAGCCRRELTDRGVVGSLREVPQGEAKVHLGGRRQNLMGQSLRAFAARAQQEVQSGVRIVLHGVRHGRASSIVVMLVPRLGWMCTVCVIEVPRL
jgi:hypothetical protein